MDKCTLTDSPLTEDERDRFSQCLCRHGVDGAVWDILDKCLLKSSSPKTKPLLARLYRDDKLIAAAYLLKCTAYGKSLFSSPLLYKAVDAFGMPSYIWIRIGFCADAAANPGFVADGLDEKEIFPALVRQIANIAPALFITDTLANGALHAKARVFPYVCEGSVDVTGYKRVQDYLAEHKSLKRKIKEFENKGGRICVTRGDVDRRTLDRMLHCVKATMAKSAVHTPFQDVFLNTIALTCSCSSPHTIHFIALMDDKFIGYHSFIRTGSTLRMLHGAFDREQQTTFHAYENLIIDAVRYALENGLTTVHFGPIMNETKRRLMAQQEPARLYYYSNNPLMRTLFPLVFPRTRMQDKQLLAFAK